MPNETTPTDAQFLSAAAHLDTELKEFHQALKAAGKHTEHTDAIRGHVSGSRWMYQALFGQDELARLERKVRQDTGLDIPPAGTRVDAQGHQHG